MRSFSNSERGKKKLRKPPEGHRINPKPIRIHPPKEDVQAGWWGMSCPDTLDQIEDLVVTGEDTSSEFANSSGRVCRVSSQRDGWGMAVKGEG